MHYGSIPTNTRYYGLYTPDSSQSTDKSTGYYGRCSSNTQSTGPTCGSFPATASAEQRAQSDTAKADPTTHGYFASHCTTETFPSSGRAHRNCAYFSSAQSSIFLQCFQCKHSAKDWANRALWVPLHSLNYTGFPSAAATYTQQIVNKQLLLYGCYSELCQSISGLPVVNRAPNLFSLKWSPPYMATTPIVTHTCTPRTSMGQLVLWKHLDKH